MCTYMHTGVSCSSVSDTQAQEKGIFDFGFVFSGSDPLFCFVLFYSFCNLKMTVRLTLQMSITFS